MNIDFIVM